MHVATFAWTHAKKWETKSTTNPDLIRLMTFRLPGLVARTRTKIDIQLENGQTFHQAIT